MFTENAELTKAANRIVEFASKLNRGELLPYQTIETISGIECGAKDWGALCRKVRFGLLNNHNIAMRAQDRLGYLLLSDVDQVRRCASDRQRRARKQLSFASREVGGARIEHLDDKTQQLRAMQLMKLEESRRCISSSTRMLKDDGLDRKLLEVAMALANSK